MITLGFRRSVFDDIGFFNGTTKASDDEFFQRLGAFTTQHGGEIREVERPEHYRRFFRYPVIRDLIPVAPDMSRLANPDLPVIACLCSMRIPRKLATDSA